MSSELTTSYVPARDGAHLAMQRFGAGPDLLVLTGGFSHVELRWEDPVLARTWRRLASFARVTTFDPRGSGLSERVSIPPPLTTKVNDVLDVMAACDLESVSIHGSYEGGCVALMAAAEHPDKVVRLVLESTAAKAVASHGYPEGIPPDVWLSLVHLAADASFEELADLLAPSRCGEPAFRGWFARWVRNGSGPGGLRALLEWIESVDLRGVLGAVACPVTVVHSRSDPLIPLAAARYIADHVNNGELTEVDEDTGWYSPTADVNIGVLERLMTGRAQRFDDRMRCAIMFSDIAGSTATAASIGDSAWRRILDDHDRVLSGTVVSHQGRIVKTTGDGALAIFDNAARAVQAAEPLVAAIQAIGLDCRVGIHFGEVERRADDIAGVAVHVAARICAIADPCEVLLSEAAARRIPISRRRPAGTHELRGLDGNWPLFKLVASAQTSTTA